MINYHIQESLYSLLTNPLRSFLSVLGVILGVTSVVAMLAIGLGAQKEVEGLLTALGAQNIHITSNSLKSEEWNKVLRFSYGLSHRDSQLINLLYPRALSCEISKWTALDVNRDLPGTKLEIFGVDENYLRVMGGTLVSGRVFSSFESKTGLPVAVIGDDLANLWFNGNPKSALGEKVRINRKWFHIIGVIKTSENSGRSNKNQENTPESSNNKAGVKSESGSDIKELKLSQGILTPLRSARLRLGPTLALSPLERIVIKVPLDDDPLIVKNRLETYLKKLHRGAEVLTIVAADEVIAKKKAATRLFTFFLLTIALISLVVGGIGIANVMLASMVERIREVGLRRAIGAKRKHILFQFLVEAVFICFLGGIAGTILGVLCAFIIGWWTGWSISIPTWGVLVSLVISAVVGIIAGMYPALKASQISPIEALQGRA